MRKLLNILIIDDHQLVRDGIKILLLSGGDKYDFKICEVDTAEKAIQKVTEQSFDIILADYQLPDILGPEMVGRILGKRPKSKILVLSGYDEYACVKNMLNAGVKGYALKSITSHDLINAIESILSGKKYYSAEIEDKINSFKKNKRLGSRQQEKFGITTREIQILKLIAKGLTNEMISKRLKLSKRTIDTHRQNLLTKFDVHNTAVLLTKATELSII